MKKYQKILDNKEFLEKRDLPDGTIIFTVKGVKSDKDFIVKARFPSGKFITPKHAHLLIDLYGKLCYNKELGSLVFQGIKQIFNDMSAKDVLKSFSKEEIEKINNSVGYPLEYILNCLELIVRQEEINYPSDKINPKTGKPYLGKQLTFEMFKDVVVGKHPVEAMLKARLRI